MLSGQPNRARASSFARAGPGPNSVSSRDIQEGLPAAVLRTAAGSYGKPGADSEFEQSGHESRSRAAATVTRLGQ